MQILTDGPSPLISTSSALISAGAIGYCFAKVRLALSAAIPESAIATKNRVIANISVKAKKIAWKLAFDHLLKMVVIGVLMLGLRSFACQVNDDAAGYLIGRIVAAIVLGPFSGALVLSVILVIQTVVFKFGTISSLGFNIINAAIIGTLFCYYIYFIINRSWKGRMGFWAGIAVAAVCSRLLEVLIYIPEQNIFYGQSVHTSLQCLLPSYWRLVLAAPVFTIFMLMVLHSLGMSFEGRVIDD